MSSRRTTPSTPPRYLSSHLSYRIYQAPIFSILILLKWSALHEALTRQPACLCSVLWEARLRLANSSSKCQRNSFRVADSNR